MLVREALHWSKQQKFLLKKHMVYGSHPLSPMNTYVIYRCFSNVRGPVSKLDRFPDYILKMML